MLNHTIRDAFFDKEAEVTSIRAFSKGLIVASEVGHFSYWKKFDSGQDEEPTGANKKLYIHTFWGKPRSDNRVTSLDINTKENTLLVGFQNNHIATCNLSQVCRGDIVIVLYLRLILRRIPLK